MLDKIACPKYNISCTRGKRYKIWDLSSAGRASALQAEGHRFESYRSHFYELNNVVIWRNSSVG